MNRLLFPISAIFVAILAMSAQAAQWKPYFKTENSVSYIDIDSIKGTGNLRRAWASTNYDPLLYAPDSQKYVKRIVPLYSANCSSKAVQFSNFTVYGIGDEVLVTTDDYLSELKATTPGTSGRALVDSICGLRQN